MNKLVIVGGGITGLAAAYLAARAGVRVTVLEAADHVGGLLGTFEVGGRRLEWFYHHAFTHDAELRWLLRELDLEDRLEFRSGTMGVYRGGRTYPFNSPRDLLRFRPLGFVDKARFAGSSLYLSQRANWRAHENVAALDWFNRYAGRRTTEALWEPLLRVKFGTHADQTPLAWMIGRLRQRMNSRRAGQEKLGYLRGSLHVLLQGLLAAFARLGVTVQTGVRVNALTTEQGEVRSLQTSAGTITADSYLFTIPTTTLAGLLQPVSEAYADRLRQVEYFGAVCTILELKRALGPVYWLNVADPGLPFGGVIEHTHLVPASEYGGRHVVYLSRYFSMQESLATLTHAGMEAIMLDGLRKIYPSLSDADIHRVSVFSSRTAAVVCGLNFSSRVPECRTPLRRLYLAAMLHVYPDERSCNNSIRVAAEACRVMGIDASAVPRQASLAGLIGMD